MTVELRRRRFTVDEYYAMAEAGILHPEDRVELIEGEIVQMAAIGSRHAACVNRLTRLLIDGTGDRAVVTVQNPVRLSDLSEPQPDFAVLRPREDYYANGHPGPGDVLLLVEVAHTTLGYDREIKLPLYATAGIPEVWIVDVEGGTVEVYGDPAHGRYEAEERAAKGAALRPRLISGLEIAVADILG